MKGLFSEGAGKASYLQVKLASACLHRRARSYRHLGPAPGATVVPKAATGRLDETHARACLAMTGFAVLLNCPTRLNASVVAIDAPDALTITQGETMVQSGWGMGTHIRHHDGGRSGVHGLLLGESNKRRRVRRSPTRVPWALLSTARNTQGLVALQRDAWGG